MILESASLKTLAAGIVVLGLAVPAVAEEAAPDTGGGRYSFHSQADGQGTNYVRLDMQTGEVSLCSRKAVGMACETAPEDRAVLENEIGRLRGENAALKKELLSHGLPLPPGDTPEPLAQDGRPQNGIAQNDLPQIGLPNLRLPTDAEIDRVVDLAGRVWHRLIEAVVRAQKQMMNKS